MIVLHGANAVQESYKKLIDKKESTGIIKQGYIATAEFLGFEQRVGMDAYTGMDIALSAYGLLRLTLKPDTWRLFRYINTDYVRNFRTLSKTALALKIIGNGPKLKLMYDTHTGKDYKKNTQ